MKQTFYVPTELVGEVKSLVRNYKSLRFLSNPLVLWSKTEFRIEGCAEDFNSFNQELEEILNVGTH